MAASSSAMQSSKGIACQTFYENSIAASREKNCGDLLDIVRKL